MNELYQILDKYYQDRQADWIKHYPKQNVAYKKVIGYIIRGEK